MVGLIFALVILILVLRVECTDIITTIAGTGTTSLIVGDGNTATSAYLDYPTAVCMDASGRRLLSNLILPIYEFFYFLVLSKITSTYLTE